MICKQTAIQEIDINFQEVAENTFEYIHIQILYNCKHRTSGIFKVYNLHVMSAVLSRIAFTPILMQLKHHLRDKSPEFVLV